MAGVKAFGNEFGSENADGRGQGSVESADEIGGRDRSFEREAGDLPEGVDAGVGAAGALRQDGFASDVADGMGEGSLDSREGGLDLPAVVVRAIVRQGEFPEKHERVRKVTRWMRRGACAPDWLYEIAG